MESLITIPDNIAVTVDDYLNAPTERMAFLSAVQGPSTEWRVTDALYLNDEEDYDNQSWHGMDLADHVRAKTLQWATQRESALIEVHSHGRSKHATTFSKTDLLGLSEVAPQMLWRLQTHPYAALVLGGGHDLDGLFWAHRSEPPHCPTAVKFGADVFTPTGLAVPRYTKLQDQI